jgi:hypothetical protein
LPDAAGVLPDVLFRFVKDSDLLLANYDHPLAALYALTTIFTDSTK